MLKGDFPEAHQDEIVLHDDHPPALTSMLRHLYGLDYTDADQPEWTDCNDIASHLRVYVVAGQYICQTLKLAALKNPPGYRPKDVRRREVSVPRRRAERRRVQTSHTFSHANGQEVSLPSELLENASIHPHPRRSHHRHLPPLLINRRRPTTLHRPPLRDQHARLAPWSLCRQRHLRRPSHHLPTLSKAIVLYLDDYMNETRWDK
ncbi:hypothetical protein LTR95_007713 [Oleoguttula sp. CCFEE 5521]